MKSTNCVMTLGHKKSECKSVYIDDQPAKAEASIPHALAKAKANPSNAPATVHALLVQAFAIAAYAVLVIDCTKNTETVSPTRAPIARSYFSFKIP